MSDRYKIVTGSHATDECIVKCIIDTHNYQCQDGHLWSNDELESNAILWSKCRHGLDVNRLNDTCDKMNKEWKDQCDKMLDHEVRTLSKIVVPRNQPIFSERTTIIGIDDEGSGEYVTLIQSGSKVLIEPGEWEMIKETIDEMIGDCRG